MTMRSGPWRTKMRLIIDVTSTALGNERYGELSVGHVERITLKEEAMWCTDPFLSGDSVTETISEQGLGKHIPMETNTQTTIELQLRTGCSYMVHTEML
jgi:hypothetical protein